jgi:hypothetical protein
MFLGFWALIEGWYQVNSRKKAELTPEMKIISVDDFNYRLL